MELPRGQRALTAAFASVGDARAAAGALRRAGITAVAIQDLAGFPLGGPPPVGDAGNPSATLPVADRDVQVLMAAFPSESGMAGPVTAGDGTVVLVCAVPEEKAAVAEAILRRLGGIR